MKYIMLEHHPNDSRLKISEDGICQTLNQRMGTGGGNVPLILSIHEADGQNATMMEEVAYALVTGGGKPGQGYPCVMVIYETEGNINRQMESDMPRRSDVDTSDIRRNRR